MSSPGSLLSNTFLVDATANGRATAKVILDTGAPFSLLETGSFAGAVPNNVGSLDSLTIGDVTLLHVPTVGRARTVTLAGKPFGGLVGFTAFGQFDFSLNYRDRKVSLGPGVPDGLETDGVTIPFTLEGGDVGPIAAGGPVITIPASRVIVTAEIEEVEHELLVDSGASVVGLRRSVFDALSADGRGLIQQKFELAAGVSMTDVIRLRSVVVGGMEIRDPPAASSERDPETKAAGIEDLLDSLSIEVGRQVDGLLGGAVLREFFVTFGYPTGRLSLTRYATRDHIQDEFRRVGFTVAPTTDEPPFSYGIQKIYDGTDAARQLEGQSIREGGDVISVDGKPLPADDPIAADAMLLGEVGQRHRIEFAAVTLDILVDELLPLP